MIIQSKKVWIANQFIPAQLEIKDSYYEGNPVENIFDLLELSKDELKKLSDLGGKMYDLIDEDNWIDKYGEQYT